MASNFTTQILQGLLLNSHMRVYANGMELGMADVEAFSPVVYNILRYKIINDTVRKKTFVRKDDGELMEIIRDKFSSKTYLRTASGKIIELDNPDDDCGMEVFYDPITGKSWVRGPDGELMELIKDEKTGKMYLRTKSGRLQEIGAHLEFYKDPITG